MQDIFWLEANKNVARRRSKMKNQGILQIISLQCNPFTNDEDGVSFIICTKAALK